MFSPLPGRRLRLRSRPSSRLRFPSALLSLFSRGGLPSPLGGRPSPFEALFSPLGALFSPLGGRPSPFGWLSLSCWGLLPLVVPSLLPLVSPFLFFLRLLLLPLRLSKRVRLSCSTKSTGCCGSFFLMVSSKFSGFSPRLFILMISKARRAGIVTMFAMKFLSVE